MSDAGPVNSGHGGFNQDLSITGVIGTLGTADIGGTALTLPIAVNPSNGAVYVDAISSSGTIVTSDAQYAVQVDESGSGTSIVGEAVAGGTTSSAIWRIKKIVDTGGTQTVLTWADGNTNFDNVWDNRGTMNFS